MGNRSYLYQSKNGFLRNGEPGGDMSTYEYNNGLALLWMSMFRASDIVHVEFEGEEEGDEIVSIPLFQCEKATALTRLLAVESMALQRYGDKASKAISAFIADASRVDVNYILLNPVEYYMFGFEDMTDLDVALQLASEAGGYDWEYFEQVSGYETIEDDYDDYPFIGERYE